ncbi:chemosensory receptor C [Elysia marginata]|uniref:Chemosensory receptor C n=1 Tax=Elysia marginata TaxID=1093978 RepID=A0AAV4HXV4_9GAST|nr:chemosensory receptor C [Elysia marginata]
MEIDRPDVDGAVIETNATLVTRRVDITSEATLWLTSIVLRVYVTPVISAFGLVTNIINILVFSRLNLKQGATATFLVLSISDGSLCLLGIISAVFSMLKYLGPSHLKRTVNVLNVTVLAACTVPKYASDFSTVVIAVVRCCSVAMPLRVRAVLTVRRQLMLILLLVLTAVAILCYSCTIYKYILVRDPQTNWTHLILTLTPGFTKKVQISDQYRGVIFYSSFIAVNICLIILIYALKQSSQFRIKATGTNTSEGLTEDKTTRKERQVVRTVVMVSLVFTVCNLPSIALTILRATVPGFRTVGYLFRSFDMLFMFVEATGMTSAAINIVVYLYSNSNYRKVFNQIFRPNHKK